jgi:acetate---CoA ligase (ADP-forming)
MGRLDDYPIPRLFWPGWKMADNKQDSLRSLDVLLRPDSVAILGASSDPRKIGGMPVAFSRRGKYSGRLYPVNPNQKIVQDIPAYETLADVPEPVDLAVIALPAAAVPGSVKDAISQGARSIAVFSSGFAELGGNGAEMQRNIEEQCRLANIPLLGPNCLGYFGVQSGLYLTFSTVLDQNWPNAGPIGLASQSGAFSTYYYAMAAGRGLGFSHVIATGNEADVDVAECLSWLAEDENTKVIVACLEGCRDGDRLRDAFDRAAVNNKPVIIMKVGASEVGAAAAASHTGALAGADRIYDVVFEEHGVYRARSINELVNVSYACATGKLPRSRRLGILTTSGGLGVLMADEASRRNIELPAISPEAAKEIKEVIPFAATNNPIDATAHIVNDFPTFSRIVNAMMQGGSFDSIIIFLQQLGKSPIYAELLSPVLLDIRKQFPELMIILCMGASVEFRQTMEAAGILLYEDPVDAVASVDAASRLAARRIPDRTRQTVRFSGSKTPAQQIALAEDKAKQALAVAGIPFISERKAESQAEAVAAATEIGFPVAMKILSADIMHKSDIGGVKLDLESAANVQRAWDDIMKSAGATMPEANIDGVLISKMAPEGVEIVMGVHRDPIFGLMTMVGLGGKYVEIFNDVAFRSASASREIARDMIDSLQSVALLRGARGQPPVDVERLIDILVALSEYALTVPQLSSVEINPYIATANGGVAVDALVMVISESE